MSEKVIKPEAVEATEKKPEVKKAKVLDYNKKFGVVVYEFDGVVYQSNALKYDGKSEFVKL